MPIHNTDGHSENYVYGFINTLNKTRMVLDAKKPNGEHDVVFFASLLRTSSDAGPDLEGRWKSRIPKWEMIHLLLENCDQNQNTFFPNRRPFEHLERPKKIP